MAESDLRVLLSEFEDELRSCMKFWFDHSADEENGGFLNCLSKDGSVYDGTKYGWQHGRQVWMYSYLYNEEEEYHTESVLKAAISGGEFLRTKIKSANDRCYFAVTSDGRPLKLQRQIFSECFYVIAMSELSRATKSDIYKAEALKMMEQVVHWARHDDSALDRPKLPGAPVGPLTLGVPMIILGVIQQLRRLGDDVAQRYSETSVWCTQRMLQHVQRDGSMILENISTSGEELPGTVGRLMNPGHAIEGGWFLLKEAHYREDNALAKRAIKCFIDKPLGYGWDSVHSGIFYFLDADGHSPTQLEWDMKLFWVHCEALVALLYSYQHSTKTGSPDPQRLTQFRDMWSFTRDKFRDSKHGEWFAYLDRECRVKMDFKAGAFKGCFHVPRCLIECIQMLRSLLKQLEAH